MKRPPRQPDYKVGYKKPPKSGQFRKGKSGNPAGRPKKQMTWANLVFEQLNKWVSLPVNGRLVKLRKKQIIASTLVNEAAKGNLKALSILLPLMTQLELGDEDGVVRFTFDFNSDVKIKEGDPDATDGPDTGKAAPA